MARDGAIDKTDLLDAALLFGGFQATFSARDFTDFLQSQVHGAEEEAVDEVLADFADAGKLRRIGPGIYARPKSGDA